MKYLWFDGDDHGGKIDIICMSRLDEGCSKLINRTNSNLDSIDNGRR
jgi:hypothetical protein